MGFLNRTGAPTRLSVAPSANQPVMVRGLSRPIKAVNIQQATVLTEGGSDFAAATCCQVTPGLWNGVRGEWHIRDVGQVAAGTPMFANADRALDGAMNVGQAAGASRYELPMQIT